MFTEILLGKFLKQVYMADCLSKLTTILVDSKAIGINW